MLHAFIYGEILNDTCIGMYFSTNKFHFFLMNPAQVNNNYLQLNLVLYQHFVIFF